MSRLRVIAGCARGRRLLSVPGDTTRPITDRVREALFDILGADIQGARFLDLFCGTGSVGIEALSRGAGFVLFVDRDQRAVATTRANLLTTGLMDRARVVRQDAFALIREAPNQGFDYIYIAPPQYQGLWKQALHALDAQPAWLNPGGWVIVQMHPKEYEAQDLTNLTEFDQRRYGSTLLVFYR